METPTWRPAGRVATLLLVLAAAAACGENNDPPVAPSPGAGSPVRDNASLFQLISQTEPFAAYTLFPDAEEFTDGRLVGSEAHRPIVRVTMNALASSALQNGRLPDGSRFPDGSIIFKEVRPRIGEAPNTYAVMYKDPGNAFAADGWVWAEFAPSGSSIYSIANRGSACTSCHQLEQGTRNDLVRTFERQR